MAAGRAAGRRRAVLHKRHPEVERGHHKISGCREQRLTESYGKLIVFKCVYAIGSRKYRIGSVGVRNKYTHWEKTQAIRRSVNCVETCSTGELIKY